MRDIAHVITTGGYMQRGKAFATALWAAFICLLAACGGGGAEDSGALGSSAAAAQPGAAPAVRSGEQPITFSPATIVATIREQPDLPQWSTVTAVVTAGSPSVLRFIHDDANAPFVSEAAFFAASPNVYELALRVKSPLAAGARSGQMEFRACTDNNCTQMLADAPSQLPYQVTILPKLQFNLRVDGAPIVLTDTPPKVRSGSAIDIEASEPVTWLDQSGGLVVTGLTRSATRWSGTVRSLSSGAFFVSGMTTQEPAALKTLTLDITP
jgi:hypothetical protein